MNKHYFILPILFISSFSLAMSDTKIDSTKILAPSELGNLEIYHDKNSFSLFCNGEKKQVHDYDVDPMLRKLDAEKLKKFLAVGLLKVSKYNNDEFAIKPLVQGLGGGPGGATAGAYIGKAAVSLVGHGAIFAATTVAGFTGGPIAAFAVGTTLESWFAAPIEAASYAGAIAGGIIGAVATGPA